MKTIHLIAFLTFLYDIITLDMCYGDEMLYLMA